MGEAAGELKGRAFFEFDAIGGQIHLKDDVKLYEEHGEGKLTKLIPDLSGVDPDDAFSRVPYEKGFSLLYYLEGVVGGPEVFDPWMKAFLQAYKFQAITSWDMVDHFTSYFAGGAHGGEPIDVSSIVDWDAWFFNPGMPHVANEFDTTLRDACDSLADQWVFSPDRVAKSTAAHWATPQFLCFLDRLVTLSGGAEFRLSPNAPLLLLGSLILCASVSMRGLTLCRVYGAGSTAPN